MNRIEKQYHSNDDRLHAVVDRWLCGKGKDWEPSWRELIWVLDHADENRVADNMRHFAEPVLGMLHDSVTFLCSMYSHAREKTDLAFCTSYEDQTSAGREQRQSYKTYPS